MSDDYPTPLEQIAVSVIVAVGPARDAAEQQARIERMKASGNFPGGAAEFAGMIEMFADRADERWQAQGVVPADTDNVKRAIAVMRLDLAAWQALEQSTPLTS